MSGQINKKLLPMKAHYYLFNAGTAPVVPFIPTFAKQLGYSPSVVGTIYLFLPIFGMIAKPLFGAISDKFHKQKFVFLLFQFIIIISFAFILVIPTIPSDAEFHCREGEDLLKFCPKSNISKCTYDSITSTNDSFNCDMICTKTEMFSTICDHWKVPGLCQSTEKHVNIHTSISRKKILRLESESCYDFFFHNSTIDNHETTLYCPANKTADAPTFKMNCSVKCDDDEVNEILSAATGNVYSTYQFWMFFILLIISWVGMAVVVSVGDAICFGLLADKPQRYGHQRLWGSAGWGTLSIISGLLIDKFSQGTSKNYAIGFYLMAGILLLDMLVSSKLKYTQTKHSSSIFNDVIEIMKQLRIHVFLLWCIAVGFGTAMIWNFLFWHLEDIGKLRSDSCSTQDSMKTLQGLVMAIQCFGGELPFFFLSGKILKKIGHVNAMSLVLFGFGCRFFLYSILSNPWYVLPIELLNGVTFGLFYSTMASYASIISPPGTEATMQGLVGAVFEGIGVSIGSYLGGQLMENFGSGATFGYFAYGAFAAFIVHVILQYLLNKCLGPYDLRCEYQQPYNSIATEAFSIADSSDPVFVEHRDYSK